MPLLSSCFDDGGEVEVKFRTYGFEESYTLAQSIHCQVALGCIFIIAIHPETFLVMMVPICVTGLLGIFWCYLSRMADRGRAHRFASNFAFGVACTTPALASFVGTLNREELLAIPTFSTYYWLLFSEFFMWLHSIYLSPVRLHIVHATLLICNILMPSFTAPSETEELACLLLVMTASFTVGHALEVQCRSSFDFRRRASAERMGDSRLNHVIKNKACAASFITQRIEDSLLQQRTDMPTPTGKAQTDETVAQLRLVASILYQSSQWCHLRELFVQLQSGAYVSVAMPTKLDELIRRVAGRPTIDDTVVHGVELVHNPNCPAELVIDSSILMLCLEEAFSNIAKYSDPSEATSILLDLHDLHIREDDGESEHARASSAALPSQAPPASPMAGEATAEPSAQHILHVYVDSIDRPGMRQLSPDECVDVMGHGHKRLSATVGAPMTRSQVLSDGLGLDTIQRACNAVGGNARLFSFKDSKARNHTQLHMQIPASLCDARPTTLDGASAPNIAPDAETKIDSTQSKDATESVAASLSSYRCIALEDDPFMRAYLSAVLETLGVHPDSAVLGEDGAASVDSLFAAAGAKGLSDMDDGGKTAASAVDLIIMDENLHFGPKQTYLGSDLAVQLRRCGYGGRICIYSGESLTNSSRLRLITEVDLVLIKGTLSVTEVCSRLTALLCG